MFQNLRHLQYFEILICDPAALDLAIRSLLSIPEINGLEEVTMTLIRRPLEILEETVVKYQKLDEILTRAHHTTTFRNLTLKWDSYSLWSSLPDGTPKAIATAGVTRFFTTSMPHLISKGKLMVVVIGAFPGIIIPPQNV